MGSKNKDLQRIKLLIMQQETQYEYRIEVPKDCCMAAALCLVWYNLEDMYAYFS